MAIVFKNLIFLEHPRTGSTSLRHALKGVGGQPHRRHTDVRKTIKNVSSMSVVRNPYDLLVSWWLIIGERQGFETLSSFIKGCEDPFMVRDGRLFYFLETDYILRFEQLEHDVNPVLRAHRIRPVRLPHHNKTLGKRNYRDYYNEEARALAAQRYGAEIERFGYEY
jgi:hypothetical protein